MPAPPLLLPFEDYLARVNDETNKAACYRVATLALRQVPDLQRRWDSSPTKLGLKFIQQGTHMAFFVTLAALLEETTDSRIVNLHKLLGRLDDARVRRDIAARRGIAPAAVYQSVQALQVRFQRDIAPLVPRLKDVRDNVVAHHGRDTDWPDTTIGLLNLAMIRVVVFVDALHQLATGDRTNIAENVRTVRNQAASLWSKGIDGDSDVARGPEDHDEWESSPPRGAAS